MVSNSKLRNRGYRLCNLTGTIRKDEFGVPRLAETEVAVISLGSYGLGFRV